MASYGTIGFSLHGEDRERFSEAERSSQVLAQLEERLSFLPSGGDGRQERGFTSGVVLRDGVFESSSRLQAALNFDRGGERRIWIFRGLGDCQALELLITLLQNLDDLRVERLARLGGEFLHDLVQGQRAPVLPVRSQRVEIVDRGKDARPDRNFCALQSHADSRPVPFFVMSAHDGHDRIGEAYALQNFRADQRVDLHLLELFRGQPSGLRDDVFRNRQLADVVQAGQLRAVLRVPGRCTPSSFATSMA